MHKNGYFYLVLAFITWLVWHYYPSTAPPESPALPVPIQSKAAKKPWSDRDWHFTALAKYRGRVRILSRKNYWLGLDSKVAPTDLVFAWGPLAEIKNFSKLTIKQSGRWYFSEYSEPLDIKNLDSLLANVHIIPAYTNVRKTLKKIRKGDVIDFSGYLVEVNHPKFGQPWRSSLSRDDSGAGACEILYATELKILPRK